MTYLAASLVTIASILGIVLTVITLPGTWLAVIVAALCTWWRPELMSWWVIASAAALAALGEIIELFASAVGAARTGGTRNGAVGAVIGGIAGAILGSFVVPILGTIVGAIVGAGAGAMAAERGMGERGWRESMHVGVGAAAGRAVATVAKTAIAIVIALTLSIAAFVP